MTLHTAKGLEYDAVFLTGVEEDILPHRMSSGEPGGLGRGAAAVLRRHHARAQAPLPLARDDAVDVRRHERRDAEPVPARDPGRRSSTGGSRRETRTRAADCGRARSTRAATRAVPRRGSATRRRCPRRRRAPRREWTSAVTNTVRDNGDLTLEIGDRIRHTDFGDGKVTDVTGIGAKKHRRGAVRHGGPQAPADQDRADREARCRLARPPAADAGYSPSLQTPSTLPAGSVKWKRRPPGNSYGPSVTVPPAAVTARPTRRGRTRTAARAARRRARRCRACSARRPPGPPRSGAGCPRSRDRSR